MYTFFAYDFKMYGLDSNLFLLEMILVWTNFIVGTYVNNGINTYYEKK